METRYESSFLDWLKQRPPGPLLHPGRTAPTSGISSSGQPISGTPTSMAPEQWRGTAVPATDQYALAIMAYQLLTWRSPLQGTQEQLMHQHLYVQPQPPSTFNPRIPPAVNAVILQALAKRPEDRYPSIIAFANAFQQALQVPNAISTPHIASPPSVGTPYHTFTTSNSFNFRSEKTVNNHLSSSNQLKELLLLGAAFLIVVSGIGFGYFSILKNQHSTIAQIKHGTPSLASTVTSGTPIFADNLRSNTNGRWTEGEPCVFTGGSYHILGPRTNSRQLCGLTEAPVFDDAAIQVDVSLLTADIAGVVFRYSDRKFYDFEIFRIGAVASLRYQPGADPTVLMSKKTSAIAPGNQKNRLLVITKKGNFKFYINDVLVGEVQDGSYDRGVIGFIVKIVAPTPSGEASFSNLKVFKP